MSEDGEPVKSDGDHAGVATADTVSASDAAPDLSTVAELALVDAALYEVGEEIARGGLGRILRARDKRLDRIVAIKELIRKDPGLAGRFAREALLTARLQHPAVIPVYEAGRWPDGGPFYAMKLVSGRSLEAALRDAGTLDERLVLIPHVIDVVDALAYAHEKGIIHRDLKPANILVGGFGETVVIDWGLAKDLRRAAADPGDDAAASDVATGHTVSGAVLGTPAYMPPEQAMADPVDQRADVYALGAILYHLLAGEPPFTGNSTEQILLKVAHEQPDEIEARAPGAPPELVAIARKAMARRPADRYASAGELAEDLHLFRHGKLVGAHRYSTLALLVRSVKRHRAAVTVAVVMATLLIALGIWSFQRIVRERNLARAERAEAQRLRLEADRRGDELSLREFDDGVARDPRQALVWLQRLSPTFTRWGAARIRAADALARGMPFRVDGAAALGLALSPDGALLAEAHRGELALKDVHTTQIQTLRGPAAMAAFSDDGQKLAWGDDEGVVRLWDRKVRAMRELGAHLAPVQDLAFGDGALVSAGADGSVKVWDLQRAAPPVEFAAPDVVRVFWLDGPVAVSADGAVRRGPRGERAEPLPSPPVAAAADGRRIAVVDADRALRVWTGRVETWGKLGSDPTAVAAAPGLVATGDSAGEVRLWRDGRPELLGRLGTEIVSLAFAGDGTLVASAHDRTVVVWDAATRRARWIPGHDGEMLAAVVSRDGALLVTAARDDRVRFFDLRTSRPRVDAAPATAWAAAAGAVALAGDGEVRVAGAGGALRIVGKSEPGTTVLAVEPERAAVAAVGPRHATFLVAGERRDLGAPPGPPVAASFSFDGRRLAVASAAEITVYDVARGGTRRVPAGDVRALAFSPGGALLAAAAGDHVLLVTADRLSVRDLGAQRGADAVAFSPDSHWVASAGADGTVRLASVRDDEVRELRGASRRLTHLAFAPDGKIVIGAGEDGNVRVWEMGTGKGRALPGHGGAVTALAVSADGRWLATGSADATVRLWDVDSGATRVLLGHTAPVRAVAFVPGAVVSAAEDGTVRTWPDDLPEEPEALRARIAEMLR